MQKHVGSSATGTTPQSEWGLEELMERLDGDQDFLRELLVMFRQDAQVNLEKSQAAIGTGDYELLSRTAHTMKGMLRNLSMGAAAEKAAALETASQEKRQSDSRQLLDQLVKELERILPEVEAQLAGAKP
jgi:HPt (histidine-containing phosphotransfer) domain-containing protein